MENAAQNEDLYHVPAISREFDGVRLGDRRLDARVLTIVEQLAPSPAKSLPQAAGGKTSLQAMYRFLNNDAVGPEGLMQGHVEQTLQRCRKAGLVVVAHDTTEFEYKGNAPREGLGPLRSDESQGFLCHLSLALAGDGSELPLGALAQHTWSRQQLHRRKAKSGRRLSGHEYAKIEDKETDRWAQQVDRVKATVGGCAQVIHVMDREADMYPLLQQMVECGERFVVRASHDRSARSDAESPQERMRSVVAGTEGLVVRQVDISSRNPDSKPKNNKGFPARKTRSAKLTFSAQSVQLKRPKGAEGPEWLTVNVVHVLETDVPDGAEPVEWYLYTTEPIDTSEQVESVVDYYRARWVIEEMFKALKTGCAMEKRQLESFDALLNTLALCVPIAWHMLLLRTVAHKSPEAPAEKVLSATQIEVLRTCGSHKLPVRPTAKDVLTAVAVMGGYLPNRRGPGWLVLGRGMEKLLLLEAGWTAARLAAQKAES